MDGRRRPCLLFYEPLFGPSLFAPNLEHERRGSDCTDGKNYELMRLAAEPGRQSRDPDHSEQDRKGDVLNFEVSIHFCKGFVGYLLTAGYWIFKIPLLPLYANRRNQRGKCSLNGRAMSLENYLVKSRAVFQEIRSDFSPEEKQELYNRLKALGYEQYRVFVEKHLEDILKYISLSPSQRGQKKWVNRPDALLIRMAASQISCLTQQLCCDIEPITRIVDSGSYRQFHSEMPQGVAQLVISYPLMTFFHGFQNPFLS